MSGEICGGGGVISLELDIGEEGGGGGEERGGLSGEEKRGILLNLIVWQYGFDG